MTLLAVWVSCPFLCPFFPAPDMPFFYLSRINLVSALWNFSLQRHSRGCLLCTGCKYWGECNREYVGSRKESCSYLCTKATLSVYLPASLGLTLSVCTEYTDMDSPKTKCAVSWVCKDECSIRLMHLCPYFSPFLPTKGAQRTGLLKGSCHRLRI